MPARQTQLPVEGRTPDSVELFVQPGSLGFHATTYPATEIWGAHKDDPATAAYRCALRFFWGKGSDRHWTFEQLASVGLVQTAADRFVAMKVPFKLSQSAEFKRAAAPAVKKPAASKQTKPKTKAKK